MSTDTSKFSLQKAHAIIHTRLEALTFKPFRSSFGWIPQVVVKIDGIDYCFRYYEDTILAPLSLSADDRVFIIKVFEDIKRDGGKHITHLKTDRLILKSSHSDKDYGQWYFQESWFRPTCHDSNYLDCTKSIIRAIPNSDEEFRAMVKPSKDFGIIFWSAIADWTSGIFRKRELRNSAVQSLYSSAVENTVIARNLMAVN